MTVLRAWWTRFVERGEQLEDARPYALVRILTSLVLLADLLHVAWLGLVPVYFVPYEMGGLSRIQDPAFALAPLGPVAGPVLHAVATVCFALTALGVQSRVTSIVGVIAYAQLGHLYPPGDRGIDRMLRFVLAVLVPTAVHRVWTVRGTRGAAQMRAWTGQILRLFLVLVYLCAALGKLLANPLGWLGMTTFSPVYRCVADPLAGVVDPAAGALVLPLFRLLSALTIAVELSSPLLLGRFAPLWALGGIGLHVGIALTMDLGAFSWGMLALYPIILARWFDPAVRRADLAAWRRRVPFAGGRGGGAEASAHASSTEPSR